jgi:molybdopterin-guanine dinucleotide biosynthesis protein
MNKNRKMAKLTIDLILAFSERFRIAKKDRDDDTEYITSTMLSGIYNVLIYEGYSKEHLDKFFFNDDYPNTHKERTDQVYKFYYTKLKKSSKTVEEFFNEDPAGIKLRKEIDRSSEKFNQ